MLEKNQNENKSSTGLMSRIDNLLTKVSNKSVSFKKDYLPSEYKENDIKGID